MNKVLSSFLALIAFAGVAAAQPLPAQTVPYKEFEQHGNLFDIKVVPTAKEVRLYLVGKEKAIVKFDKLSVTAKIRAGKSEKIIQFHKGKDYFTTTDEVRGEVLHLKAKNELDQTSEEFHIDMQKP